MIKYIPSSLAGKVALGVGVAVAAPLIYRVMQRGEQVTTRNVVKEGIRTYNQVRIALAETKENLSDLAAEAQAEAQQAAEETYEAAPAVPAEAPKAKATKGKATSRKAAKGDDA